MKKAAASALALMLAFALAACGGSAAPSAGGAAAPGASQQDGTGETAPPDGSAGQTAGLNEGITKWPDNEYTQQIPKPTVGLLFSAASLVDAGFAGSVARVSGEDFAAYTESCLAAGWSEAEGDETFNAIRGDYKLSVNYAANTNEGQMNIVVDRA
ncbi:MAG: hypothetical protein VB092_04115 [Oscillospiraceae bacterium]|nr:hypothetical protein [Oscillospiraceae bacterium]